MTNIKSDLYILLIWIVLLCPSSHSANSLDSQTPKTTSNSITERNYQTGPLSSTLQSSNIFDFATPTSQNSNPLDGTTRRPSNFLTGQLTGNGNSGLLEHDTNSKLKHGKVTITSNQQFDDFSQKRGDNNPNRKQQDENLSTDCLGKRNEILQKHQNSFANKNVNKKLNNTSTSFQRLKPKQDNLGNLNDSSSLNNNSNLDNQIDGEHVPQCNQDGAYEPIQCHKIGYCWCVNKFGQAIKNSASLVGQKPVCNDDFYESESNGLLVVTGTTEKRIKGILKSPKPENNNSGLNHNNSSQDSDGDNQDSKQQQVNSVESDFERRVSTSKEPSLALVPNECSLSRLKARERASNYSTDVSIWIPRCDTDNSKMYAEKQCHNMKQNTVVCWCVDQTTGLPLRTNEQLGKQPVNINCTEIKRLNGIIDNVLVNKEKFEHDEETNLSQQQGDSYKGFSDLCDVQRRVEFVSSLINQFRIQIQEFVRDNPITETSVPSIGDLQNSNESQIAEWKFVTLDADSNGILDNREWFRFKDNFKLIDKIEELNLAKSRKSKHGVSPLNIIRTQRRCWRDFLLYCNNGRLSNEVPINLNNWMNCTQLPSKTTILPFIMNTGGNSYNKESPTFGMNDPEKVPESIYESLKAVVRSKHKNPFLGILKPD